ncbi:MAG: phosphatidylglycerophosphatase A [Pseudomonadota bacterium]
MTQAERFATLYGIGQLPGAQGTYASLATLPFAWALHWLGGFWLFLPVTLALVALAWWATRETLASRGLADGDPQDIVIDEVAGQLIALWPLSLGLTLTGAAAHVWPWPGVVAAFLLFRFFDIWKPGPIGWAERLPGATGIMADDCIAGLAAAMLATIAAGVAHGWF